MNKFLLLILFAILGLFAQAQNATFITLAAGGSLAKVTVGASGCISTPLNLCSGTTGTPLSIALNGNLLYVVDNKGFLYSTILNATGACNNLGKFLSASTQIYGLTVDKNGKVFAANGSQIETYDPSKPAGSQFKIVGNVPAAYTVGGDLLFYLGQLYMSCKNNVLLAIDTLNPTNSSPYLTFSSPKVFGFASVSVPCSNNQAYALSTSSGQTDIIGVDMANKTETGTVCTLNYQISDAASVAESGAYTPPTPPTTNSPISYCQNATATPLTATATGTLYWYNTATGGTSNTIAPTPNTATVGTTTFYVSQKDATGCESERDSIKVIITPNNPTTSTTTINTTTAYNWNGAIYTTSGTYTKTGFINSTGCDSTATLILTITQANPCWKMISTGGFHTSTIKTAGTLWAWGDNTYGQLGDATNINKSVPTQIGSANNWASVSNGEYHTIAIKTDGTLWAWGWNNYGQLGDGTYIDKNIPIQIGNANNWASVSAGGQHTVAIKTDGTLWAWGCNGAGQVGDGTNTNKNIPTQIGIDNNWAITSTQYYSTIAEKIDGTLWAWGSNGYGQLGLGNYINKNVPTQIGNASDWTTLSTGFYHTIAQKTDGTLWAWGDNYVGQLGDGTNSIRNTPVKISIDNDWAILNVSGRHSMSLKKDNTLWAWGLNASGELGEGTIINKYLPIQIGTDNNWAIISAGDRYTVGIKIDGSLWAWGDNTYGQLGNPTLIFQYTPKLIINGCTPCPAPNTKTTNLSDCKLVIYKGIPYKVSAAIKDTIKTVAGCDSIYNIANITITPSVATTKTTNLTSCKPVVYNSIPYNSSTIVRDTIRTSQGCDSIYNVANITIAASIATVKTINLFDCKTVTYNSIPYTSSTTLYDTIKSVVGCGDSIYFTINISITPTATTIVVPLFDCKTVIYKTKTYSTSISFIDTVKGYFGCDSIYNNVAITIAPATKIIPITLFNCKSIIYKANTYTASTSFTDIIKGYQGCDSIQFNVTITIASPATIFAVPLFGCKSVTYKTKSYIASTSFIDTIKGSLGCDSIYYNVAITIAPTAVNLPINLKDCKSITYNNKPYTTSTSFIDTVKNKQGCDSIYNNINITITTLTTTQTTLHYAACGVVNYSGNVYHSSTKILDTFKTATGCDSAYKTTNITIYPIPTIVAGSDVFVLLNNSVVLNPAITNALKIEWTPAFYLNNYNTDLVNCTPLKDIVYKIKTTSKDGCTDSAFQKVFVDKALNIPNVFTPNGDNVNDTWAIDGLRVYPKNIIQIFNRYGQNIFTSSPGNYKPWNGKLNGNDLPVGTYYYIIKLSADASPIAGSITILR